jgi:hypothetical protein
MKEAIHKLDG